MYIHSVIIGIKNGASYEFIVGNGTEWSESFVFSFPSKPFHAYIINELDPSNPQAHQIIHNIAELAKKDKGMKVVIDLSKQKQVNPLVLNTSLLEPISNLTFYQVNIK